MTLRTLLPWVAAVAALAAGCGPPPEEPHREYTDQYAESVADVSSSGASPTIGDASNGVPAYSELQALYEPDVTSCGDDMLAWSPLESNPSPGTTGGGDPIDDWLVLQFPFYMFVDQVKIFETYNPGAIVAVDLERSDGGLPPLPIYENFAGEIGAACPSAFVITVTDGMTDEQYDRVAIYIDSNLVQDGNNNGNLDDDWPEIDAVQMLGDILIED